MAHHQISLEFSGFNKFYKIGQNSHGKNAFTTHVKSFFLLFVLLCAYQAYAQNTYEYQKPAQRSDGWITSELEDEGINKSPIISSMNALLASEKLKVHSYLIVKNGKLVFEEYFSEYDADKQHDLRSVTKSMIALLTGIAIEQKLFSLDDPVQKHLVELQNSKNPDPRKAQITIRHLLTMSSGLDCNDWDKSSKGQEDRIYKKKNWIQALADLPMINDPGNQSFYCTGGVMMLATILERRSGMTLPQFAKKHLLTPLGIDNYSWGHTNKKEVINAGKRLYMLPRDMAKIGLMIMQDGLWNSEQIIPQTWIEELHETKTRITNLNYSFWWWQIPFPNGGAPITGTIATGNGGQYIMCFPEEDLLLVFTGGAYNSEQQQVPFGIVNNYILPALK